MKIILLAGLAIFGLLHSASAFVLAGKPGFGPDASWQIANIGYGLPSDDVVPNNVGEEFRRNTPVMYYACDSTFLNYFGSNGMAAVQSAFDIMNKAFTNNPTGITNGLDGYSSSLSEFPFESRHVNYQAQALGIFDVKSFTLNILVRQMGLADPVEYTWTLHDRTGPVSPQVCPAGMEYFVTQRNLDVNGSPIAGSSTVNSLYSPYVNNTLYSYFIEEVCQNSPVLAETIPVPVDPLADTFSAVATQEQEGLNWGEYYSGLTRDDIMGLRYMMSAKTIYTESPVPGSLVTSGTTNGNYAAFPSNPNVPLGLGTFDLGALLSSALTNDPVTLEALFPGVLVGNTFTNVGLITNLTVVAYLTNFPGSAATAPPTLIIATNKSFGIGTNYTETFLNVVTNHYYSNTVVTLQTVTIGPDLKAAAPAPIVTNITSKKITLKGVPSGDYYFIPTNMLCGVDIVNTILTNKFSQTNLSSSFFGTNIVISTNGSANSITFAQTVSTYTNYVFRIAQQNCSQTTNSPGLYRGIEKINFVETFFDDYIGTFYQPITNNYTSPFVNSNGQEQVQKLQRVVTSPDFLFNATDLADGNNATDPTVPVYGITTPNFDTDDVATNANGPGTIIPQTILTFDKVGPVYFNNTANFLLNDMDGTNYFVESPGGDDTDLFYSFYFVWGTFDNSTNAPIVYPDGPSLDALGNLIVMQITPTTLPNGNTNATYTPITFNVTGGTVGGVNSVWSASGLPLGMSVSSGGTLSGRPTQVGSFVFTLSLTDTNQYQTVTWNYPLTIQ